MSLLSEVGRKTLKARIFIAIVYASLIVLGITMIVPFMITISGSMSNDFDYERFWPVPRYLWSKNDRFVKCLVPYFNHYRNWTKQMQTAIPEVPEYWSTWPQAGRDVKGIDAISRKYLSNLNSAPDQQHLIAADYAEFTQNYPLSDKVVYASKVNTIKFLMNSYENKYEELYPEKAKQLSSKELRNAALALLGKEWGLPFESFYNINFNTEMNYPMDFQSWFPPLA